MDAGRKRQEGATESSIHYQLEGCLHNTAATLDYIPA